MTEPINQGLTAAEVQERIARGLVNRVRQSVWADYRAIAARNAFTLFNALVVPAAIALFALKEYRGAIAVSGMALVNMAFGLVQELRAKWHLDRLALLAESKVRVRRNGREEAVLSGDVVRDDVVLLTAGDPIVADGTVLESQYLEVDEALLTGESDPVPRKPGEALLSGSFCVAGDGAYRLDKVGAESFAQQTTREAREYRYAASPIQKSINRLIQILTALALLLCALYVPLYFVRGFEVDDLVKMVAATVTSMVPQGLVLMTTLALTLGAVRMSRQGAVVQHLSAVESMAAVNVLCMDKTGTLTTNRLRLDKVHALGDGAEDRLRAFAWASADEGNKSLQALRLAFPEKPAGLEVLDRLPFKSQNRYSAVRVRGEGTERVLVLGAVEALKPLLEPTTAATADETWRKLLPTGLRLLLFAEATADGGHFDGSLHDCTLRPLALVALSDELRPDAGEVLEQLAAQGVAFKIISGDNPETVRATVGHLRLPLASEAVVTGDELAKASDPTKLIDGHSVFGRIAPRQKVEIVTTLQRCGRHVAMIGDGVNDVLSIKRADLGIAMGEGAGASKTVAELVLENNRFSLLPATLEEGRLILRNVRRAGRLFLLKNVYTLILIVVGFGIFNLPFSYEPQQVTLLNGLTIGVPTFLIMLSRGKAKPPRTTFLRQVGGFALGMGCLIGTAGLTVQLVGRHLFGDGKVLQQTLLLSTLVPLGLYSVLRSLGLKETGDRKFWLWAACALGAYLLVMHLPLAAHFFELQPLAAKEWALVLSVVLGAIGVDRLWRWGRAKREQIRA